jgi:hypothetical protein
MKSETTVYEIEYGEEERKSTRDGIEVAVLRKSHIFLRRIIHSFRKLIDCYQSVYYYTQNAYETLSD